MTRLPQDGRHLRAIDERVRIGIGAGDQNNRGPGGCRIRAQLAQDGVPVDNRHHEVEQDGVGSRLTRQTVGLEPVRGGQHAIPPRQRETQELDVAGIVVNNQHHRSAVGVLFS